MIRAFVDAGARSAMKRDVPAVCAQLADVAQIRMVEVRFSGPNVKDFDKAQWCALLKESYAALPPGMTFNADINLHTIEIAADGQAADVAMDVTEELSIGGRGGRMTSQQSGTLVLQGGKPIYSKISARVVGGQ